MRRGFGIWGLLAAVSMALPGALAMAAGSAAVIAPAPIPSNARKRARRARLIASGYGMRRSKGAPARRKLKPNRLHVSRRARRRLRRARGRP